MSKDAPAKRKSRAVPIAFIVVALVLIGVAIWLYSDMRAAADESLTFIVKELKGSGTSSHLTELKVQWAWVGFAIATGIAGVFTLIGAVVQLFRKEPAGDARLLRSVTGVATGAPVRA